MARSFSVDDDFVIVKLYGPTGLKEDVRVSMKLPFCKKKISG